MKKTIIIFGIILSILLIKSNTNAASVYQTQAEQQINNGQVQYSQQQAQATTQQVNENGETAQAVMQNTSANTNQQQVVYSQNKSDTIAQATNKKDEGLISEHTKGQLIEIRTKELKSIEDYQKQYGNPAFGVVAYILDKVRIYSIPLAILGIAVSAIYEYVLGTRHMEALDKGFNSMIAVVTALVVCQLLPLIFAIIVRGWRG
ncbi:MAG: hypothetical protein HXK65_00520 [Clostridiales bacterium]|nr:hypothetical protein [Clostridiales bacterium]MBF0926507.1 hypothetical protein [Clostridiales bacterium]